MKKILIISLMSILSFYSYSQVKYESGYFIDNEGKKTDCLIKNIDWKNAPIEFTYKLAENSKPKLAEIENVAEFGILKVSKYKRFTVDIERSSEAVSSLSTTKDPEFGKEQLFLKVIVQGKATLYLYEDKDISKFFFGIDSSNAEQLIFKSYLGPEGGIAENNTFRKQLLANLNCQDISMNDLEKVGYNSDDLVEYFTAYNYCQHSEVTNFSKNEKHAIFNLTIRPGLNISMLTIETSASSSAKTAFENKSSFRLGVEAEIVMPFNRNKWAIIAEPTFQYFKSTAVDNKTISVDYKSIEFPLGIRYSFFLNDKSKIFIDGSVVYDIPIASKLSNGNGIDLDVKSAINFAFGAGYKYNNKYSIEARFGLPREILVNYANYSSNYRTFSIILGYTIF